MSTTDYLQTNDDLKPAKEPAPLGSPQSRSVTGEDSFETGRPRMGGSATPLDFDTAETEVIHALGDTVIPPGGGFPAPSEVGIATFFGRYTTPAGYHPKYYPHLREDDLRAALANLGAEFIESDEDARIKRIVRLESEEPDLFEKLRGLVYYGYYAAVEVTLAINKHIPAGRDYHGPPLPYGYIDSIEPWDEELLATAGKGAGAMYIHTDEVTRVDLSGLEWLQQKIADTTAGGNDDE